MAPPLRWVGDMTRKGSKSMGTTASSSTQSELDAVDQLDELAQKAGFPRPHGLGSSAEGGLELGPHVVMVRAPRASRPIERKPRVGVVRARQKGGRIARALSRRMRDASTQS
jgi:hypothetical protein